MGKHRVTVSIAHGYRQSEARRAGRVFTHEPSVYMLTDEELEAVKADPKLTVVGKKSDEENESE